MLRGLERTLLAPTSKPVNNYPSRPFSTPQAIEEKAKEDQIPDPFADSEGDEAEGN